MFILETEKTSFLKFSDKVLKILVWIEIITGNPLVYGVNTAGGFSSLRQLPRVNTLEPLRNPDHVYFASECFPVCF